MRGQWEPPKWEDIPDPRTAFRIQFAVVLSLLVLMTGLLLVERRGVERADQRTEEAIHALSAEQSQVLALSRRLTMTQDALSAEKLLVSAAQTCIIGVSGALLSLTADPQLGAVHASSRFNAVRQECKLALPLP